MNSTCKARLRMNTMTVKDKDIFMGTYSLQWDFNVGFNISISEVKGFATVTRSSLFFTFGLNNNSALTFLSKSTPATVRDSKYGSCSASGMDAIRCASGSGSWTSINLAVILSQLSKSDRIFILSPIITWKSQSTVIIQILQPGIRRFHDLCFEARLYSLISYASVAEVMSHMPYPRLSACTWIGR